MVVYHTLTFQCDNRSIIINVRRSAKPEWIDESEDYPKWVAESENFPGWTTRADTYDALMHILHRKIPTMLMPLGAS